MNLPAFASLAITLASCASPGQPVPAQDFSSTEGALCTGEDGLRSDLRCYIPNGPIGADGHPAGGYRVVDADGNPVGTVVPGAGDTAVRGDRGRVGL
jgi:hypothetical protein